MEKFPTDYWLLVSDDEYFDVIINEWSDNDICLDVMISNHKKYHIY